MICSKCGAQADGKFCPNCGAPLNPQEESAPSIIESAPSSDPNTSETSGEEAKQDNSHVPTERNDAVCPFCKAPECTPMQKSTTETKTKGYKWGSGCCGMFLLGPFGLLCGLLGTGSKTKTENELWWACNKCGKRHIALDDAASKYEKMCSSLLAVGLILGVVFAIANIVIKAILGAGFIVAVIAFVVPLVFVVYALNYIVTGSKNELTEQLGEPIELYLTKEQLDDEKTKKRIAIVIAIVVCIVLWKIWDSI